MSDYFMPRELDLPHGVPSTAWWADNPSGKLVVFVHGFGGSAVGTWSQFATLLPEHPNAAGCDMLFFGYDGLKTQANVSAAFLRDFLHGFLTDPAAVITPSLRGYGSRPPNFSYSRVVIAAHSLGAVVTRSALLQAHRDHRPWLPLVRLVLFAPAHRGAKIVTLASEALAGIPLPGVPLLGALLKMRYAVLQDLEPDSPTLEQLLEGTAEILDEIEEAGEGAPTSHLVAHRVLWAQHEKVVTAVDFARDPNPTPIVGVGHMKVCKPGPTFAAPVDHLGAAL